jgi:hypothetical protein
VYISKGSARALHEGSAVLLTSPSYEEEASPFHSPW